MKFIQLLTLFLLFASSSAWANVDSLILSLEHTSDDKQRLDTYILIGKNYVHKDAQLALFWTNKAEKLARNMTNNYGLYTSIKLRSEIYMEINEADSALTLLHSLFDKNLVQSSLDSADTYNLIGVTLQSVGRIDEALEQLNLALEIYREQDSKAGLTIIKINMGNCFYEAGRTQEALNNFKEAYEMALELQDEAKFSAAFLNYAMLTLYLEGDTEKVDQLLTKVKDSPFIQKNENILAVFYQNLAVYYSQVEDWKSAENHYKQALTTAQNSGHKIDAGIYTGLGQIYVHQKKYAEALLQYNLAKSHSTKTSELRLIYNDLANLYAQLENLDSAQHYWQLTYELVRKQENEKTQELVLKSKNNLELIKKENEIELLAARTKSEQLQNRINLVIIFGLIVLIALIILITYLLLQRKKKELVLKDKELQLKKQKLTSLSLRINQKNQVLKDFESTVSEEEDKSSPLVNDAKMALKNSLRIDEDWEEFELFFNDLHSGFYDELKKRYPNLSNNELKICTLSKLRFSLKEIAQTLFLSVDSVKSARYRIRKKLNMEKGEDLSDFLNNLNI
ncbi:Tetratricopeptide repeat-containing protein [Lishizhenia tianjinensis]|uniref:Tetratricopeptide repeat-containing protein n=1 Tax=Lishizhenia tianjinensis TaxID=477690 RepID=A0A1I7A1X7_9FLAO|nr:tetratricopeptide repeat protein [Lishizhenia tianjinensis]SFT68902.1 Tetratricopeptide repeat-containing protein [Lishizhenia tianjinensis]